LGKWEHIEKGEDWKETSICTYANDGTFKCEIEEHGCTKSGWCEAQSFLTSGTWLITDKTLTLDTTIFKKSHTQKFKIVSLKADKLVLKLNNQQQIWKRSSSAN
jgi:hypothetical protein